MRHRQFLLTALGAGIVVGSSLLSAQQIEGDQTDRRIVKPGIVAAPFEMKVETKPRFPNQDPAEAAGVVENNSLAVSIQPEKKEFAGNGPLSFLVTFTNKADAPRMLYQLQQLGKSPKLVIANQTNANQWTLTGRFKKGDAAVKLEPGEKKTYTLVVEAKPLAIPQPIPLPRPIPLPQKPQVRPRIVPPKIQPPVVVGPGLPCGQGLCRAKLLLEFETDPRRRYQHPTWTGKIATGTVEFKVGKPAPIGIRPPGPGGPVNKARAIQLAKTAAERALENHYRPAPPLKPAHQGNWIENSEKTANVEANKAGGWTVSWTHFPKKGFSYNIKVEVQKTGRSVIKEVFASYSDPSR